MILKGLCIIPEGTHKKDADIGLIYDITRIKSLEEYLHYAKINNLGTLYLSSYCGLVYADDVITQSPVYLYRFSTSSLRKWSAVVAEQIYRECLNHCVSVIHLMTKNRSLYKFLINNLKLRGVRVILPLLSNTR